jgi:hypothetical protein
MLSFVFTFACLASVGHARTSGDQRDDLALMLLSAALAPQHAPTRHLPNAVMKAIAKSSDAPIQEMEKTKKKAPAPVADWGPAIAAEWIVLFEDAKHKTKMLGVVKEVEVQKKKGETFTVQDATEKRHRVMPKQVYIAFKPNSKLSAKASTKEKLAEYNEMAERKPGDVGVEITDLDLVWEIMADEKSLTLDVIMDQISPELCKTGPGRYWAFKYLTSELGKIYFKRLHSHDYRHVEFKPKPAESVQASKEKWCDLVSSANPKIKTMKVFQEMCLV